MCGGRPVGDQHNCIPLPEHARPLLFHTKYLKMSNRTGSHVDRLASGKRAALASNQSE